MRIAELLGCLPYPLPTCLLGKTEVSPDKGSLLVKRSCDSVANRQDPEADGRLVSNIISGEAWLYQPA